MIEMQVISSSLSLSAPVITTKDDVETTKVISILNGAVRVMERKAFLSINKVYCTMVNFETLADAEAYLNT